MTEGIIIALITGAFAFLGELIINSRNNKDVQAKIEKSQAVTETKLDELTREVRAHNNFAQRMPVVEEQIKIINHRLSDLEHHTE